MPGSWTHYLPFGGYDNGPPTADITDLGYTGHRHNDDLGLIYMNARYYDPFVRRFISADGLVPDQKDPQTYNRYSYARNNPLKYIDPTGHLHQACIPGECGLEGNTWIGVWAGWEPDGPVLPAVGVSISGSVDTPMVSVEGNIGEEYVFDVEKGEITSFLVIGQDISVGPNGGFLDWLKRMVADKNSPVNLSASIYFAGIHNVEDVATEYSGRFIYETTTATYKWGGMFGEAYSPSEVPKRKRPYSDVVGIATGYALTRDYGRSYYIPVRTYNLKTGEIDQHNLLSHFQPMWKWLVTDQIKPNA